MGDTLDTLAEAANADVNVVLSSTAFYLAQYMRDTYGIPYVVGIPMGENGGRLIGWKPCGTVIRRISQALRDRKSTSKPSTPWPTSMPGRRNRLMMIRHAMSWSSANRSTSCR